MCGFQAKALRGLADLFSALLGVSYSVKKSEKVTWRGSEALEDQKSVVSQTAASCRHVNEIITVPVAAQLLVGCPGMSNPSQQRVKQQNLPAEPSQPTES